MTLDTYQPCPCGSGKKIKFCCSHDIVSDLDKVLRTLAGDQRVAALDQIGKLIASKGPRAALLAVKATVQMDLGEFEPAQKTVDEFLRIAPDNPVALSQSAALEATHGDTAAAVDDLQDALERIGENFPAEVYEVLGFVGRVLLNEGNVLAARAHIMLQASIGGPDNSQPLQVLTQIDGSRELPQLLKQTFVLAQPSAGAAWSAEFNAALVPARRGAWLASSHLFATLAKKFPDEPAIMRNVAILCSWLGNRAMTVVAWRRYAAMPGVSLDDAVEAEALAQLLDPATHADQLDEVTVSYPLRDMHAVMEKLLSDRRASRMDIDLSSLAGEDEPPPKAVFWLLDRPLPATSDGLTRDSIPRVLGEMYVFGKQTDREARLEFSLTRTDDFETRQAALRELLGDLLAPAEKEEVTGEVSAVGHALSWSWRWPDDAPVELREALISNQRRDTIFHVLPNLPLGVLEGRRPCEVSGDPAFRVRLLAAILLLDLAGEQQGWNLDFNELRRQLQLPTRDLLERSTFDSRSMSLISLPRLSQLNVSTLSDEDLTSAFHVAAMTRSLNAVRRLATEMIGRPSFEKSPEKLLAYQSLSGIAPTSDEAIAWIHKAIVAAEALRRSPAEMLLSELVLRLGRGESEEVMRLIKRLQTKHISEPSVAQQLYSILVRFGVIAPNGAPAATPAATRAPEPAGAGLWTSDGPAPAAAATAAAPAQSKLWLPGMD